MRLPAEQERFQAKQRSEGSRIENFVMSPDWGPSSPYGEDGVGGKCSTRRMITSKCRTEEVDGRLIRKCEKTEKILRECVGR